MSWILLFTALIDANLASFEIINNGDVCYRLVNEMTMCSKGWQDTGGCNGNCDSVSKCASHVNWGTPGFLVDRGNYGGVFCAQCQSVEEIAGGNNNYDLYEYVDCPSDCACTFTGWQHYAEGYGNTGTAWTSSDVGTWVNVGSNTISSLKVEGECALSVADGNDGANPMDYIYSEGVYNFPLPTGNDNINSVRLQCADVGSIVDPVGSWNPKAVNIEPTQWTLALTVKNVAILVLVAMTVVMMVAVYFVCAQSRGRGTRKKYQRVQMADDSGSEDVGLVLHQ